MPFIMDIERGGMVHWTPYRKSAEQHCVYNDVLLTGHVMYQAQGRSAAPFWPKFGDDLDQIWKMEVWEMCLMIQYRDSPYRRWIVTNCLDGRNPDKRAAKMQIVELTVRAKDYLMRRGIDGYRGFDSEIAEAISTYNSDRMQHARNSKPKSRLEIFVNNELHRRPPGGSQRARVQEILKAANKADEEALKADSEAAQFNASEWTIRNHVRAWVRQFK
jgi:hypothetical protein